MATLWQDIKYGIRMLARNPGFAIVVVLILGLGIGATTAVFSVVNGVLLRPLPYKDPGRVVMVFSTKSSQRRPASRLTFQDWQSQSKSFEDMAVSSFTAKTCRHEEGTDRIEGMRVSSSLFGLLGLEPLVGRTFLPEETWPDHQYVILGYDFWKRRFGCDESALGSSIMLGPDITLAPKDELHTVIGVMPPGIGFLNTRNPFLRPSGTNTRVDFWVPVNEEMPDHRGSNVNWDVVGRLKRGVTIEMAQAEMDAIASRVAREHYADPAKAPGVEVVSLHEYIVGRTRRAHPPCRWGSRFRNVDRLC
ncbi:MAG: ABC transporter permease [Planctomycetota bacterium]|jgi:putative ABC transport system permease protein